MLEKFSDIDKDLNFLTDFAIKSKSKDSNKVREIIRKLKIIILINSKNGYINS